MNEEQTVKDFFSKAENLHAGLAVAEQMDEIRAQMNNRFWRELLARIGALIAENQLRWSVEITEDRNAPDTLVGLHCAMRAEHPLYLRPMIEQQYLGETWRIYSGLMWSESPSTDHLGLPSVVTLRETLQKCGYRSNTNFLAWQWTPLYPRRKDFLLGYQHQPQHILDNAEAELRTWLIRHRPLIEIANAAVNVIPRTTTISLDKLRSKVDESGKRSR
jgi:hypothetical protein